MLRGVAGAAAPRIALAEASLAHHPFIGLFLDVIQAGTSNKDKVFATLTPVPAARARPADGGRLIRRPPTLPTIRRVP